MQLPLVRLHADDVVYLVPDQLPDNLMLAGYGINGHDTSLEVKGLYQPGDGLYLVTLFGNLFLAEAHAIGRRPCAYYA